MVVRERDYYKKRYEAEYRKLRRGRKYEGTSFILISIALILSIIDWHFVLRATHPLDLTPYTIILLVVGWILLLTGQILEMGKSSIERS